MRRVLLVVPLVFALASGGARAARHTTLAFTTDAIELQYSQGQALELAVTFTADDSAVPGSACTSPPTDTSPCRIRFSVAPTDDLAASEVLGPVPDDEVVVDDAGSASKRVVIVDGVHGADVVWTGLDETHPDGVSYTVTATFLGEGSPDDADCLPAAPDVDDGKLCSATATATILVTPEVANIFVQPGSEGDIDTTIQVAAHVDDPNGDAELGSSDLDGPGVKNLEGYTITFFYDVDGNHRPDASEKIADAVTNSEGNAAVDFLMSHEFVAAGDYEQGLWAQLSSGGRYGVSRASSRVIVHGGEVDAKATILEVSPKEVPADGTSLVKLTARLVDVNNDLLDEAAPPHVVAFTTDIGSLQKDVVRDLNTGTYSQKLKATREGGDATITVVVDGKKGKSATVTFVRDGCQCGDATLVPLVPCLAALAFIRRRKR